ncbi:MAG: hypothetical protein JWP01_4072 [Myxococcales bacterium]|nr:hypothetical protein [Myxococcales bacterium]
MTDTPDDAAERTKQLAKKLLEALDAPTDPEKEARLAEKEARDKEALEKYYRETNQPPPAKAQRARSVEEMRFAMSLEPCPACQTARVPDYALVGQGDRWSLTGSCVRCQQPRSREFVTVASPPPSVSVRGQLGGDSPSEILRPGQLLAELDRVTPQVRVDPAQVSDIERQASAGAIERALTCLTELLKFIPPRTQLIPDTRLTPDERDDRKARRERYSRDWLTSERDRLLALATQTGARAVQR